MSSVGDLLMVVCDCVYTICMYIILFGIMRFFEQRRIGEDLLLECRQQTVKFGG